MGITSKRFEFDHQALYADVAIVGGGILGLAFALEARQQKKLLYLKEIRGLEEPLFEILG